MAPGSEAAQMVADENEEQPAENFRFYDNRQKYLMFVHTCSEKQVVADRVSAELDRVKPKPPALRVFDAGMGDGTVLTRVMRTMHQRHPRMPFYIAGKEISLEDVRLTLEKMPDRFYEHPATVLVVTNLNYADAPWMTPSADEQKSRTLWKEVKLKGETSAEFDSQITDLEEFLAENWRTTPSPKTGNPIYERPVVLVIYREDCEFLLHSIVPKKETVTAGYDLVMASQPYRARASAKFKASRVIAPLARSLAPGGRLMGIQSCGGDPALEIIQKVWPSENPFGDDRHALLEATREALGQEARQFDFLAGNDAESRFCYEMHTLPGEIDPDGAQGGIGTSTLFAAWNDAAYVAQIEDERLTDAMTSDAYLRGTAEVLRKHGGLWFNDEGYVIARKEK